MVSSSSRLVRDCRASCRLQPRTGRFGPNVEHNNCCRQQQSFPIRPRSARRTRRWQETVSHAQNGQIARRRASAFRPKQAETAARQATSDDEIGLDALAGHAGYAVRRFQIWIFQDFIRTLGDGRYPADAVFGADGDRRQSRPEPDGGRQAARDRARPAGASAGQPRTARARQAGQIGHRPALPRAAPDRARQRPRWRSSSGSPPSMSGMSPRRSARKTGSGCCKSCPRSPDRGRRLAMDLVA